MIHCIIRKSKHGVKHSSRRGRGLFELGRAASPSHSTSPAQVFPGPPGQSAAKPPHRTSLRSWPRSVWFAISPAPQVAGRASRQPQVARSRARSKGHHLSAHPRRQGREDRECAATHVLGGRSDIVVETSYRSDAPHHRAVVAYRPDATGFRGVFEGAARARGPTYRDEPHETGKTVDTNLQPWIHSFRTAPRRGGKPSKETSVRSSSR